jgi:hypothetical protein
LAIPIHSSKTKSNIIHFSQSKTILSRFSPFLPGKLGCSPFQSIPISPEPTFSKSVINSVNNIPSSPSLVATGHRTIQFLLFINRFLTQAKYIQFVKNNRVSVASASVFPSGIPGGGKMACFAGEKHEKQTY